MTLAGAFGGNAGTRGSLEALPTKRYWCKLGDRACPYQPLGTSQQESRTVSLTLTRRRAESFGTSAPPSSYHSATRSCAMGQRKETSKELILTSKACCTRSEMHVKSDHGTVEGVGSTTQATLEASLIIHPWTCSPFPCVDELQQIDLTEHASPNPFLCRRGSSMLHSRHATQTTALPVLQRPCRPTFGDAINRFIFC